MLTTACEHERLNGFVLWLWRARSCLLLLASLFRLPSQPANEIFIYFSERGRLVARNSNEMSYLIASPCEEVGAEQRSRIATELYREDSEGSDYRWRREGM